MWIYPVHLGNSTVLCVCCFTPVLHEIKLNNPLCTVSTLPGHQSFLTSGDLKVRLPSGRSPTAATDLQSSNRATASA